GGAIEVSGGGGGGLGEGGAAGIREARLTPVDAARAVQLLTRQASRADRFEVTETVIRLVSAAITGPGRLPSPPRATTQAAWRRLADGTKQILSCDPRASLHQLARRQSVAPHHLRRALPAAPGTTLA